MRYLRSLTLQSAPNVQNNALAVLLLDPSFEFRSLSASLYNTVYERGISNVRVRRLL